MTTQPQSPSEQEIRTQVENAITPPVEEVAESGWPNDSFKKAVDDVLVLINQAADKREQEVLDDLTEYYQGLLADRPATVKFPAWIGKNELQAWIDGRQGKAAEGEGKNA